MLSKIENNKEFFHNDLHPLLIYTVSYTPKIFSEDEVTKYVKHRELGPYAHVDTAPLLTPLGQLRYQATYMASYRWLQLQQSFSRESGIHYFTNWSNSIMTTHKCSLFIKQHFIVVNRIVKQGCTAVMGPIDVVPSRRLDERQRVESDTNDAAVLSWVTLRVYWLVPRSCKKARGKSDAARYAGPL